MRVEFINKNVFPVRAIYIQIKMKLIRQIIHNKENRARKPGKFPIIQGAISASDIVVQ